MVTSPAPPSPPPLPTGSPVQPTGTIPDKPLNTFLGEVKQKWNWEFNATERGKIAERFRGTNSTDPNPNLNASQQMELALHILEKKYGTTLSAQERKKFLANFGLLLEVLEGVFNDQGLIEAKNLDEEMDKIFGPGRIEDENKEFEFAQKLLENWYKFSDDLLNKGFKDLYKFDVLEIMDSAFIYYIQRCRSKKAYEEQKQQRLSSRHAKSQLDREQLEGAKAATWLKMTTGGGIYANDDTATIHVTALNAVLWHIVNGPDKGWRSLSYKEARENLPNNYFDIINSPSGAFDTKLKAYIEKTFKDEHPNLNDPGEFRYYATLAFTSAFTLYCTSNAHVQVPDAVVKRFFKKIKEEINSTNGEQDSLLGYWKAKGIQKTAASDAFWTKIRSDIASPELDSQIKWADLAKYHFLDGSFYDYRNKEAQKIQKALEAGKLDEKMIKILRTKYFAKDEFNLKYNPYAGGMYNKIMPLYNKLQKPARDRVAQQYAAQNVNAI